MFPGKSPLIWLHPLRFCKLEGEKEKRVLAQRAHWRLKVVNLSNRPKELCYNRKKEKKIFLEEEGVKNMFEKFTVRHYIGFGWIIYALVWLFSFASGGRTGDLILAGISFIIGIGVILWPK